MAYSATVLTKLVNAQQKYVQIAWADFHINQTINGEVRIAVHLRPKQNMSVTGAIFKNLAVA
jgi:hypothetical protein